MYTIGNEHNSALAGVTLSGGGHNLEVGDSRATEDLPQPLDAWQLEDFQDLLPADLLEY